MRGEEFKIEDCVSGMVLCFFFVFFFVLTFSLFRDVRLGKRRFVVIQFRSKKEKSLYSTSFFRISLNLFPLDNRLLLTFKLL